MLYATDFDEMQGPVHKPLSGMRAHVNDCPQDMATEDVTDPNYLLLLIRQGLLSPQFCSQQGLYEHFLTCFDFPSRSSNKKLDTVTTTSTTN